MLKRRPSALRAGTWSVTTAAMLLAPVAAVAVLRMRADAYGFALAALAVLAVSIPLVGGAVARSEPHNPVGWLLLSAGVALPLALTAYGWSHAAAEDPQLRGGAVAAWLDGWPWTPALTLVPTVGLLLYPDGRTPGPRWRWVVRAAWAVNVVLLANELFAPHLLDWPHRANPTALPGAAGGVADAMAGAIVLVPVLATLGAWSAQGRLRRSEDGARREALRLVVPAAWLMAASWWVCVLAVATTGDTNNALAAELLGVVVLAVTSWVAIRRHGLFDTRQVVSRAITYAGLSAVVLVVYLAVAALVDTLASGVVGGTVAAVAAVLVALPLHATLLGLANRLVHGDRDDPYAALDRVGQRLTGAAAPEEVLPALAAAVRSALRLTHVLIDLEDRRAESGRHLPGPDASEDTFALIFAGETVGLLKVARRDPHKPFTGRERALLQTLAAQVAAAAGAVRRSDEARASRERLVAATEEERRRLRRDLHDGLGPTLAGVVLGLQRAKGRVASHPVSVVEELDTLTARTQDAIADVRRLVYGLRPPALDELGLVGALAEQAERLGGITVSGPAHPPPLPAAVEVAAYRIALEAMTNLTRHAESRAAYVTITVDREIVLEVSDDGDGLPEGFRAGVGITSMRERASELGGTCTIERRAGQGTLVRAVLPVAP